ncbi:MAG: hypothetical protein PHQ52_02185 [Candidatus Omnitrophica bacterium]|nr:hypothetical protein [Candidatus Omnitrophota bacterium]
MKKYVAPKIKAVELDPKQALLHVCSVTNGIYMMDAITFVLCKYYFGATNPYTGTCDIAAKGVSSKVISLTGLLSITDAAPS